MQADGGYDTLEIQGQPPPWSDILAVFAAKAAGTADGTTVAILDAANVEALRTVFWDMTKLTFSSREVDHPASGDTPAWTERILTVTITARTPDDMRVFYSFTEEQNEAQPGDLVFYPDDEHVGIVGGRDESGNMLIIHCAFSQNNVVITGLEGFASIGHPLYYGK